jgi:hypothetical protein
VALSCVREPFEIRSRGSKDVVEQPEPAITEQAFHGPQA